MTNDDQIGEIAAFYDKLRAKLLREHNRDLVQLQKARDAALKVFGAGPKPSSNGAKPRATRLDPEVQKLILAVLSTVTGYTVKDIAKLSKASRSQVRSTIDAALKVGTVAGDANKRNRKFVLTTEAHAHA